MRLVKFGCGCIGFERQGLDTLSPPIIIKACDDDSGVFMFRGRKIETTGLDELEPAEMLQIFAELDQLVTDGYAFREIRSALRVE